MQKKNNCVEQLKWIRVALVPDEFEKNMGKAMLGKLQSLLYSREIAKSTARLLNMKNAPKDTAALEVKNLTSGGTTEKDDMHKTRIS